MTDRELFVAALHLSDTARAVYLARECPDAGQRAQVESLLRAHAEHSGFLELPGLNPQATVDHPGGPDSSETTDVMPDLAGMVIGGRFKLLEKIGEGGMGEVWVADQFEPIKRRVALKLIKPGMDSRSVLSRFEAERQALAVMDHPNIAKVLDAGTTADGRPYFVMELVKGTPITEFCDARKLTPRQRLELFIPVCQAIQHAHMKGIIHRDIKPSNILVELHDDKAVAKVIDFGVAKAVGQQLTEKTIYTGFGVLVGTPAYMAPEQATFNALDIDTRADVYALGVLLYELLAGGPPIEQERLKKAALDEVLRIVRDEEPQRPSARLSTSQAKASIAATRQIDPDKLSELMKGEIDWIVMKALEKDRTRRYESANSFAADVQRYLSGEQVQAVPPSLGYRLRKVYRKNRTMLTTAAAFAGLLIVAAVVSGLLALEAKRAGAVAEEKKIEAEANAKEAADNATLARQEAWAHVQKAAELHLVLQNTGLTAVSRKVDLDLTELSANRKVGLLRLARTIFDISDDKNGPKIDDFREKIYGESKTVIGYRILKAPSFTGINRVQDDQRQLREFITAAVLNAGQEFAPLLPPITHDGKKVITSNFTPDGKILFTLGEDGSARLWDLRTAKLRSTLREKDESVLVTGFSPDGGTVYTSDEQTRIRIWQTETGVLQAKTEPPKTPLAYTPEMSREQQIKIATNARNIVLGNRRLFLFGIKNEDIDSERSWNFRKKNHIYTSAKCYDSSTGRLISSLDRDGHTLEECTLSPDRSWLTLIEDHSAVRIVSVDSGAEVVRLPHPMGETCIRVAVSPDRSRIVTSCTLPKKGPQKQVWTHRLWEPNPWHIVPEPNLDRMSENETVEFVNDSVLHISHTDFLTGDGITSAQTSWRHVRIGLVGDIKPHGSFSFNGKLYSSGNLFYDGKTLARLIGIGERRYPDSFGKYASDDRFLLFNGRSIIDSGSEKRIELGESWETLEEPCFLPGLGTIGFAKSEVRILPAPEFLKISPAILQLWANVAARGELSEMGEFMTWDEQTWERKRQELAAIPPPYKDFPFPGYVVTDKLHWLRKEFESATEKDKPRLLNELLSKAEAIGDKNEAVRWRRERAKYTPKPTPMPVESKK